MDTRSRRPARRAFQLSSPPPRLFWVTGDRELERPDFVEQARQALEACGADCAIQLRGHRTGGRRLWELADALTRACRETGAQLWVNDRADVAVVARAHGLHLGERSLPPEVARGLVGNVCRLGFSAHDAGQVQESLESGADVVFLGNVFETSSHPDRKPLGVKAFADAAGRGRPIVAIGGITPETLPELINAGAWGVAIKSGLWDAPDPAAAAEAYREALGSALANASAR